MRAVDLIRTVRDGQNPDPAALRDFILALGRGDVPDYQATAFTMAVFFRGLSEELTVALTLAMRDSGDVVDLSHIDGPKVDKHSTGGVGDKISIPLAPLVAACGVYVPMISGRGLGHTGGTLDKLEAIPGFRVDLDAETFRRLVKEHGLCLIGQTARLAPADRKLYALRDVSATVESVPLITASILCKKLAEGIDALVLDVKVGRGAFMKDLESARTLAASLVKVGNGAGLKTRALLTRMDAPLGRSIGNALEVAESIDILRGEGPADSTELTLALGEEMLLSAGVVADAAEARHKLHHAINSGAALEKFRAIVEAQGGDASVIDDRNRLPRAENRTDLSAKTDGFVRSVDSYALGNAAMRLGAGRAAAEDKIDPAVGYEIWVNEGEKITKGQKLLTIHHRDGQDLELQLLEKAIVIAEEPERARPLVLEQMGSDPDT